MQGLPGIVRPISPLGQLFTEAPSEWRTQSRRLLLESGALLFRGFNISGVKQFEEFVENLSEPDSWSPYREEAVLRVPVGPRTFTSSEYHPSGTIFPHNEKSQCLSWPLRLFFSCQRLADSGGATPLTDIRTVTKGLPREIGDVFRAKNIRYVRNCNKDLGVALRAAFGSEDRVDVEAYCADNDIECEWIGNDRLRITYVRPAFALHPITGEELFFNLATFYHPTTLERRFQLALRGTPQADLAFNSFYGDGSDIPSDVLEECRRLYQNATARFEWETGDVAMLDNMLVAHGREPYRGERSVWIAMMEETSRARFAANVR